MNNFVSRLPILLENNITGVYHFSTKVKNALKNHWCLDLL